MINRQEVALLIGAAMGMLLWYGAPWIAGQPVPWDGGLRYLAALAVAGAIVEAFHPGAVWPAPAGIYAGQALALLLQIITGSRPRQPWPIAFQLLFVASITLAAAMGSVAVAAVLAWARPLAQVAERPPDAATASAGRGSKTRDRR